MQWRMECTAHISRVMTKLIYSLFKAPENFIFKLKHVSLTLDMHDLMIIKIKVKKKDP